MKLDIIESLNYLIYTMIFHVKVLVDLAYIVETDRSLTQISL